VSDSAQRLLDRTVDAYQQTLTLTTNRYNAGVAARAEVVQADAQLKSAQAQAVDNRATRAQFEHAIAVLIGKAPADFSLPVVEDLPTPPDVPPGVPSQLLERRPDIAAAERNMQAANAQIGVSVAAFYPDVTLSADYGVSAEMLRRLFTTSSRIWSLGSSAAETVFDGGARNAQVEHDEAAYEASVATYRQAVLTAFQQVEDDLSATRVLQTEEPLRQDASNAADQEETIALNEYRAGTVDYTTVVTAQAAALSARQTLLTLQVQRMTTEVSLIEALGGGWSATQLPKS